MHRNRPAPVQDESPASVFLHQLEGLLSLDDRQRSAFVQLVELAEDLGALDVRQRVEGRLVPVARQRPDVGRVGVGQRELEAYGGAVPREARIDGLRLHEQRQVSDDVQREASGPTDLGPDGLLVLRAPIGSGGEAIDRRGVVPIERATVLDRHVLGLWRPGAADDEEEEEEEEEQQPNPRRDERGSPDRDHFRRLSITARAAAAPAPKPPSVRRKSRREWVMGTSPLSCD